MRILLVLKMELCNVMHNIIVPFVKKMHKWTYRTLRFLNILISLYEILRNFHNWCLLFIFVGCRLTA